MRCKGKTKAGKRCKKNTMDGLDFCHIHIPDVGPILEVKEPFDPTNGNLLNSIEFEFNKWLDNNFQVLQQMSVKVAFKSFLSTSLKKAGKALGGNKEMVGRLMKVIELREDIELNKVSILKMKQK